MSVSPDEGMMLLQQRMHARDVSAPEATPPAAGAEISGELGIMVRLAAALEANTAAIRVANRMAQISWEQCHPINIPPGQSNAAGTLDLADVWQPRAGYCWQVIGISFALGAGTTSFSVWEDSPNDPTNIVLTQAVSGRWEPDDYFMLPGSRLVYTSLGGGLTVSKGKAIEIALDALPGYLGLKIAGRV